MRELGDFFPPKRHKNLLTMRPPCLGTEGVIFGGHSAASALLRIASVTGPSGRDLMRFQASKRVIS